jgi:catalase
VSRFDHDRRARHVVCRALLCTDFCLKFVSANMTNNTTPDRADASRRRFLATTGVATAGAVAAPLLSAAAPVAPAVSAAPPGAAQIDKADDLARQITVDSGQLLTSNQGLKVSDNQNSLKAGARGPVLLEDQLLREKITVFDHERIPERVVHARGAAAHGFFQTYASLGRLTKAKFLNNTQAKTPVFVRFSTVAGSRGSADTARDVRGFAVKFYTDEGNYDLVGNNIPVFFIQDAIKFPDLVHAAKPEADREIPQASTAHDTFWDFISLMPESTHMVMWIMSDRAIPRSYRMMEGFIGSRSPAYTGWHGTRHKSWPARTPTFIGAIFGTPSLRVTSPNGNWACRSSKRRMSAGLPSTSSTAQS